MKTVFVNPERCLGCGQCQIACAVEHSQSKDLVQAISEIPRPRSRIWVAPGSTLNTSFPNKCRHCNPAPCMSTCPTGAISRDIDCDVVFIDGSRCIVCAMCAIVCPFDVIRYYPAASTPLYRTSALKCDNCLERQHRGDLPACVEACKCHALQFGDINELMRGAGARLAKTILIALGPASKEVHQLPDNLEAWRGWGRSVIEIDEQS